MWDAKLCKSSIHVFFLNKEHCSNVPPLSRFVSQWTSEPYESIDATNSNAAITVKGDVQSGDLGCSQGLDKTQDQDSASASTALEAKDQKTV